MLYKQIVLTFILFCSLLSSAFALQQEPEACGISGIVLFPKERSELEMNFIKALTKQLFIYTCKRGKDASGIVVINQDKKAHMFKDSSNGPDFVELEGFKDILQKITNETTIIINHNRAAVYGSPSENQNNHPHYSGNIYAVHNGIIKNWKHLVKKYEFKMISDCDTEVIPHMLSYYGGGKLSINAVLGACKEMEGTMALAFADSQDPYTLYLLRNANPMNYVTIPKLKLLVYDSEIELINMAWEAALKSINESDRKSLLDANFGGKVELPQNSGVTVDIKTGAVKKFNPFVDREQKIDSENTDKRIVLIPSDGMMVCNFKVPSIDNMIFGLGIPETIGCREISMIVNFPEVNKDNLTWKVDGKTGSASTVWENPGKIKYKVNLVPYMDYVDIEIAITNPTRQTWHEVFAFNCFSPPGAPIFKDHRLKKTYISVNGAPKLLAEIEKKSNKPRPSLDIYLPESGMPVQFVRDIRATSPQRTDKSWIVTISEPEGYYKAVVSVDCSFLFTNTEYACIHSAPNFGDIAPGESATSVSRVYVSKGSLEDFLKRFQEDLPALKGKQKPVGKAE